MAQLFSKKSTILFLIIFAVIYIPIWGWTIHEAPNQKARGLSDAKIFPVLGGDAEEYASLALNLTHTGNFSHSTSSPFEPETFRTPGYPAFLAFFYKLFGTFFPATLVQIIMVFLIAVLINGILESFDSKLGMIAGALFMLDPTVLFFSMILYSDILLTFIILLATYILFVSNKKTSLKITFASFLLGLAVLVKPIAVYLVWVFPLLYLALNYKKHGKKIFVWSAIILATSMSVFIPWMIRNKYETGVFGLSSITAVNIYWFILPNYISWSTHTDIMDVYQKFQKLYPISGEMIYKLEYSDEAISIAKNYILKDPFNYIKYHITSSYRFFNGSGLRLINDTDAWQYDRYYSGGTDLNSRLLPNWILRGEEIFWLLIWALAVTGIWANRKNFLIYLFVALIFYFWVFLGPAAVARLRLPAEPFLLILFSLGINYIISFLRHEKTFYNNPRL